MIQRVIAIVAFAFAAAAGATEAERTIVVLGDSLSSGYGLGAEKSWVALLEDHLRAEAYGYRVVNASIAGDTSSGGLARLPRLLEEHEPEIVIIELGGNDGLRGQPPAELRRNLETIIGLVADAGGEPLLAGIQIPPNYGPTYTSQFTQVYLDIAAAGDVAFVEFLMDGVALNTQLMQGDRVHPNAMGQRPMFENVWAVLEEML